ncbi:hypothetical protein RIF29_39855 [Crotalaria pallida]|uniref:PARP-type domain-containing protein n=1 Tax=Crotalaria pallida TaxID=3830 RepID=A0AAN9HMW0_CROPI
MKHWDPPSSILAEYAQTHISSCKGCAKTINSKAVRLGLATKDPRGFEAVRWHHPSCFSLSSHLPSSPECAIKGFSALQSRDQEAVKKLFALNEKSQEKVDDTMEDRKIELQETEASASKKHKVDKAAEDIENELHPYEASDSKKRKVSICGYALKKSY